MKKKLLVLALGLFLLTGAVFAEHPKGTGIGAVFGGGWGTYGYGLYPGLSLKMAGVPVYWGMYAHLSQYGWGVKVTGDYYLIDNTLVKSGGFNLGWYLGLGGFGGLNFWRDNMSGDLGVRVPIGLAWFIVPTAELFLDVAPGIGLGLGSGAGLYWAGTAEIGLRLWL